LPYPRGTTELHHEVELVAALGRDAEGVVPLDGAPALVFGYAVGLDLTRRDLQARAKAAGLPWDTGKGFDRSAPISEIVPAGLVGAVGPRRLWLEVNGELRQQSTLDQMVFSVAEVIHELSKLYDLRAGDLVFTGTPAGVAALQPGDRFRAGLDALIGLAGATARAPTGVDFPRRCVPPDPGEPIDGHDLGIQGIRNARQRRRSRRWRGHRRRLRQDRFGTGGRRDHAAGGPAGRRRRFQRPGHRAAGRQRGCRRHRVAGADAQLRRLPPDRGGLPHHRLRHLPVHQGDQLDAAQAGAGRGAAAGAERRGQAAHRDPRLAQGALIVRTPTRRPRAGAFFQDTNGCAPSTACSPALSPSPSRLPSRPPMPAWTRPPSPPPNACVSRRWSAIPPGTSSPP